ncbi:MAG: hypothetical protein ACYTEQ_29680, partial [Planctomycetota bacterium]
MKDGKPHRALRRTIPNQPERKAMINVLEKFRKETVWSPFSRYTVMLRLVDIVGGCPKNPKLIEGWVNATNKQKSSEERAAIVAATKEEIGELSDEKVEKTSTGFKADEHGLYIEGRQVKAMLKEAANIIKNIAPVKVKGKLTTGVAGLKSKVADQMFVEDVRIHLKRDEPDEIEERPIHVFTAQGPRDALKRVEIVRDCEIGFVVL